MSTSSRFLLSLLIALSLCWVSPRRSFTQEPQTPALDPEAKKAVGKFLEDLFGEISGKAQVPPQDGRQSPPTPDPIDERALMNREQRTQLQRAERLIEEGQRGAGLRLLQHLLAADEDSLVLADDGRWRSLHATAEEIILRADPQTRHEYLRRYARPADEQLQEARRIGSVAALAKVTRRYFATPAGAAAADDIASLMIDAGEPAEAAYWYRRLIEAGAELTEDPDWRQRAARILEDAVTRSDSDSRSTADDAVDDAPDAETSIPAAAVNVPLAEWTQPFGDSKHTGQAAACDPVLLKRWSQPLTDRPELIAQISRLVEDLGDNGTAGIPAAIPLAVDGKILYRNLRGLSVIDASSGRRLWASPEKVSIERLLSGEAVSGPAIDRGPSRLRPMSNYRGNGADQHPLTNLLFRDGVYGLISSDGEHVFVLEDHATLSYRPPGYNRGRSSDDDPHGRDWETNRLAAYDLQTGRRVWSVGGSEHNDPFTRELAGTLFQGPPVIEGDELFVIGEQHGAEHLFVLDPDSGRLLWTQMLSGVSAEIEYDLVRRWWPALPAVGRGVIICPTTVGWVVAVDRYERRIRWAQRLIDRQKEQHHSRQSSVAITSPLNSRWTPSAPILVGDRVVIAPQELPDAEYHTSPRLIGLDSRTGEICWEREKETLLYVAGVWSGSTILVGRDQIKACDVERGKRVWRANLPAEAGVPSGRGVITGDDLLLPLASGQLWRISLRDGAVISKMSAPDDLHPLGNLLVLHGQLVSLSPFGIVGFEDRDTVDELLAAAPDESLSPRDRYRAAQLQSIEGNHRAALEQLRALDRDQLTADAAAQARDLYRSALIAAVRSEPASADDELAELASLAESPRDHLMVQGLLADGAIARGDHLAAFDIFWSLTEPPSPAEGLDDSLTTPVSGETAMIEDGETLVRPDRWIAGRLEESWRAMDQRQREAADHRIESTVGRMLAESPEHSSWWSHVLCFHPAEWRIEDRMAVAAAEAGRLAEAEVRRLRLLNGDVSPEARSESLRQLVSLLDRHGRPGDADFYFARFADRIGADDWAVGEDLDNWRRNHREERQAPGLSPMQADWSSEKFSVSRTTMLFNRQSSLAALAVGGELPSFDRLQWEVQPSLKRLSIDTIDGRAVWETPLHSRYHSSDGQTEFVGSLGQLVLLNHRGVLHAVSLPDRQVLWHHTLDDRTQAAAWRMRSMPSPPEEFAPLSEFLNVAGLVQQPNRFGSLAMTSPEYLCYFGRNSIVAADPLSGETLWTLRGIRPQSVVVGTRRHVFVIPPGPAAPLALRVVDGSEAEIPNLSDVLANSIGVSGDGIVTLKPGHRDDGSEDSVCLQVIDPASGRTDWKLCFAEETLFAELGRETLLAIEPDGTVRMVDWAERRDRVLAELDPAAIEDARSVYAVADRHQVYLSLCERLDRRFRSEIFLSMPVNGPLIALDRAGGGVKWRESVEDQNLILEHIRQLPVLVLFSREMTIRNREHNAQQVHLRLRNKRDGAGLLDGSRYVSLGSFRSMDVDLVARQIDFQGPRERLRIHPAEAESSIDATE